MPQTVERGRFNQPSPLSLDAMARKPVRLATHTGAIGRLPIKIAPSQHKDLSVASNIPQRSSSAIQSKYCPPSVSTPTSVPGQGIQQQGLTSSSSLRSLSTTPVGDKTLKVRKTRSTKTLQPHPTGSYNAGHFGFATPTPKSCGDVRGPHSMLPSVIENESLSPSPLPRDIGGPRHIPDVSLRGGEGRVPLAALSGLAQFPSPHTQPAINRRPSVKKRVLSKVMGSLQNNPKAAPRLRNGQSDGSLFRRLSVHSNSTSRSRAISSDISSLSSQSRDSYCSGNDASHSEPGTSDRSNVNLARLPRTPIAERPSPQPTIRPPTAGLAENTASQRPTFLTNAALRILPEVETLDVSAQRTVWTAVEIQGYVRKIGHLPSASKALPGLDIVVVVDNSKYASPGCVGNICDIVLSLAATLEAPDDRIAVFCTSCCHSVQDPHVTKGCQLHALQAVHLQSIQDDLVTLKKTITNTPRQSAWLSETIASAISILSDFELTLNSPLRRVNGHVIVLSPGPFDSVGSIPDLSPLKVHLISPAAVPCDPGSLKLSINGWYMRMPPSSRGLQVDRDSHREALRAFTACARYDADPGRITEVGVETIPSDSCKLISILGQHTCSALYPGQTITLLVQASVQDVTLKKPQTGVSEKFIPSIDDAFADLEMLLGETTTDLFTVKVRYKHSHFPENTEIIIADTCRVTRTNALSAWGSVPCSEDAGQARKQAEEVHKKLVSAIASNESPTAALTALAELPDSVGGTVKCPDFLDLVRGELEYRCQVLGCPVPEHKSSASGMLDEPSPDLGRFSFENRGTLYLDLPYRSPPKRSFSESTATVIHTRLPEDAAEEEPDDQAHKIWRHMRKSSKSQYRLAQSAESSCEKLEVVDAHLRELRKRAVQNKRSVGADTLRSLAVGTHGSVGSGVDAPWC